MSIAILIALLALICFLLAAANVPTGPVNMTALGLLFLTLFLAFAR